jgi:hypothetical protein
MINLSKEGIAKSMDDDSIEYLDRLVRELSIVDNKEFYNAPTMTIGQYLRVFGITRETSEIAHTIYNPVLEDAEKALSNVQRPDGVIGKAKYAFDHMRRWRRAFGQTYESMLDIAIPRHLTNVANDCMEKAKERFKEEFDEKIDNPGSPGVFERITRGIHAIADAAIYGLSQGRINIRDVPREDVVRADASEEYNRNVKMICDNRRFLAEKILMNYLDFRLENTECPGVA